jgi:hypothetical protein
MKTETMLKLIAWERGQLEGDDDTETVVELFQELIDDGVVWSMPGYYPRMARMLIERGHCHKYEMRIVK